MATEYGNQQEELMSLLAPEQTPAEVEEVDFRRAPMTKSSSGWLLLLFLVSGLLFGLQLGLGVFANSVALLADCAHSAVDVATYAFNYGVERSKQPLQRDRKDGDSKRRDAFGAVLSVLVLLVATGSAMQEAVRRLYMGSAEDAKEYESIGKALLIFGAVSTAANCGLLFAHRWFFQEQDRAPETTPEVTISRPPTAPGKRRGRRGGASFCQDFSKGAACALEDCSDCAPGLAGGAHDSWRNVIHAIVHPGCATGCQGEQNLNVAGAMLHLVADVLRGVTMFLVAGLIQLGFVKDVGRADAIAGICVAAFVCVGATALLGQAAGAVCWPGADRRPAQEVMDDDI